MTKHDLAAEGRAELARWKAEHVAIPGGWCSRCDHKSGYVDWPCPMARSVAALEEALDRLVALDGTLSDVGAIFARLAKESR